MRATLLLAILGTGVLCFQATFASTSSNTSEATACVVVQVPAYITISGPALVAVDLHDYQIGSPIPASVRFLVSANAQEVDLQVACTDLYKAGDPTSAHRIPVAGAGVRITCEHGHAVAGGDALLPWQHSLPAGLLPAGWTGAVTEAATFTASPAAIFSQNVAVDVTWNTTDPDLPLGEYQGYVKLIGLIRP
jgi:hypothetical protein